MEITLRFRGGVGVTKRTRSRAACHHRDRHLCISCTALEHLPSRISPQHLASRRYVAKHRVGITPSLGNECEARNVAEHEGGALEKRASSGYDSRTENPAQIVQCGRKKRSAGTVHRVGKHHKPFTVAPS